MRRVFTVLALAFLMSWALAEWPRTTRRVFTGMIDRVADAVLTVGPFEIPVKEATLIESAEGSAVLRPETLTVGQPVMVTFRCTPNSVPGCVAEKVRILKELPGRGKQ